MQSRAARIFSKSSPFLVVGLGGCALALIAAMTGCAPEVDIHGEPGGASAASTSSPTGQDGAEGSVVGPSSEVSVTAVTNTSTTGGPNAASTSAVSGSGGAGNGSGGVGGAGNEGASSSSTGMQLPTLRYDFETLSFLEGWQPLADQQPPDVEDSVVQSTDTAHHGSGALAMVFDGMYTPLQGQTPYYGVVTNASVPPPGAQVSAWMTSTVPGASASFFAQNSADNSLIALTAASDGVLTPGTWTNIQFTIPPADSPVNLGVLITSPLAIQGSIYLDDIRW